jgi:hypothetical protein
VQKRCDRNRKRSKRRAIYCPMHGCYLDSVSQKYSLFADTPGQLQERGMRPQEAKMLVAAKTAIHLQGEWLEAFWCEQCQSTKWYRIRKQDNIYVLSIAPAELWQRATGVIHPRGNPSVSEYTLRHSRMMDFNTINDFKFINQ